MHCCQAFPGCVVAGSPFPYRGRGKRGRIPGHAEPQGRFEAVPLPRRPGNRCRPVASGCRRRRPDRTGHRHVAAVESYLGAGPRDLSGTATRSEFGHFPDSARGAVAPNDLSDRHLSGGGSCLTTGRRHPPAPGRARRGAGSTRTSRDSPSHLVDTARPSPIMVPGNSPVGCKRCHRCAGRHRRIPPGRGSRPAEGSAGPPRRRSEDGPRPAPDCSGFRRARGDRA